MEGLLCRSFPVVEDCALVLQFSLHLPTSPMDFYASICGDSKSLIYLMYFGDESEWRMLGSLITRCSSRSHNS